MEDAYDLEKTGLTATVKEEDMQDIPDEFRRMVGAGDRPYAVEIQLSEPVDGPFYPAIMDEEMIVLNAALYEDQADVARPLYISGGEAMIAFPSYDTEKAETMVEHVLEKVDDYYDEIGDAPLEHYLAKLPEPDEDIV